MLRLVLVVVGLSAVSSSGPTTTAQARTYNPPGSSADYSSWRQNADTTRTYWDRSGKRLWTYSDAEWTKLQNIAKGLAVDSGATGQVSTAVTTLDAATEAKLQTYLAELRTSAGTTLPNPGTPTTIPGYQRNTGYVVQGLVDAGEKVGSLPTKAQVFSALGKLSLGLTAFQIGIHIGTTIDHLMGWPALYGNSGPGYCTSGSPCPGFMQPVTPGSAITNVHGSATITTWPADAVGAYGFTLSGADTFANFNGTGFSGCGADPQLPGDGSATLLNLKSSRCTTTTNANFAYIKKTSVTYASAPKPQGVLSTPSGGWKSMAAPAALNSTGVGAAATPSGTTAADLFWWWVAGKTFSDHLTSPVTTVTTSPDAPETGATDPAGTPVPAAPTNPTTITIPAPDPAGETFAAYQARLVALGVLGTITQSTLTDATLDTAFGPDVAVRTSPAVGTSVAASTNVTVYVNPSTAPAVAGSGSCSAWASPVLDLTPLTSLNIGTKFPFGLPSWIIGALSVFDVSPVTPSWDFHFPYAGTGTNMTVDLAMFDSAMGSIRLVLLFSALVAMGWGFWRLATNGPDATRDAE